MQVSGGTLTAEPSIDFSDVNGLKNSMVDHSKTLLAEMDRTKIQLCNIIAVYKIIKEDEQMAMINSVIDEKMEALKKF
jgi:energy-converting hydrogenase A subunit M